MKEIKQSNEIGVVIAGRGKKEWKSTKAILNSRKASVGSNSGKRLVDEVYESGFSGKREEERDF